MVKKARILKKQGDQAKTLDVKETEKKQLEAWQLKLQSDANQALDVMSDYGSGDERKHLPFRPYADTHEALMRLALDLTNKQGTTVKAHDLLIEAVNMLFKKYKVNHVARRPHRSAKSSNSAKAMK